MPARKPTATVQLTLRLREDLRRQLERSADRNEVSLNAEIIARLEASFTKEDTKAFVETTANKAAAVAADLVVRRLSEGGQKL